MVAHLGLIQLIGKWLFLAGLYAFIIAIFRALFRSLKVEAAEKERSAAERRGRPAVRQIPARPPARQQPVPEEPPMQQPPMQQPPSVPALLEDEQVAQEQGVAAQPAVVPGAPRAPTARPVADEPAPTPGTRRGKPCFVVIAAGSSGLNAGTVFPLTAAVTIGRSAENSIRVSDRFASTRHAMVFLKDGRRILRDRNSTNGTTRNGKKIASEVALSNGDLVGIGTVVLEYRSHS